MIWTSHLFSSCNENQKNQSLVLCFIGELTFRSSSQPQRPSLRNEDRNPCSRGRQSPWWLLCPWSPAKNCLDRLPKLSQSCAGDTNFAGKFLVAGRQNGCIFWLKSQQTRKRSDLRALRCRHYLQTHIAVDVLVCSDSFRGGKLWYVSCEELQVWDKKLFSGGKKRTLETWSNCNCQRVHWSTTSLAREALLVVNLHQ